MTAMREHYQRMMADRRSPHAVYRCYSVDGELLYVGCSADPARRMRQHRSTDWRAELDRVVVVWYLDFNAAREAERGAVEREHPRANLRLQAAS